MFILTSSHHEWLADYCHRRKIIELALFGPALRSDFRKDSDLDFLATFDGDAGWGLFVHVAMEEELRLVF